MQAVHQTLALLGLGAQLRQIGFTAFQQIADFRCGQKIDFLIGEIQRRFHINAGMHQLFGHGIAAL